MKNTNKIKTISSGATHFKIPCSFFLKAKKLRIKLSTAVMIAVKNNTCMATTITPSGCSGAMA